MNKGSIIVLMLMLCLAVTGQEFDLYRISPYPTLEEKDGLLEPFTLKYSPLGQKGITLRDSVYFFTWSTAHSLWNNASSTLYTYDDNYYRINSRKREWVSDSWENKQLLEFFYDDKGNRVRELEQTWNSGEQTWINIRQKLFHFNEYQNLTDYVVQKWNGMQSSWEDSLQYLYDYDEDQNWTYWEKQTWNPDSLKWISNIRFIYSYQEEDLTSFVRQEKDSIYWINTDSSSYSYNQTGNMIEETQYQWIVVDSIWKERTIISYSYNQEEMVNEKLYRSWDGDSWKNFALYTYHYIEFGGVSEIVGFLWHTTTWDFYVRYLFDYDEHGALIRETDQVWSEGEADWINEHKWEYYYTHFIEPFHAYISDSTNVSCYGYSDGTATVTITGGMPPYTILWNDPQSNTNPTVYDLSADQYYTVTVTDANLNTVSDSVMLSQPPEIITGPIYGEVNVNQNDTVTYWVESDTSSFYSWSVMHGEILSTQGGDTIVVVWTQPGQGKVSVFETTMNGCEGDTVHVSVSISPTSIEKPRFGHLKIYPNPANQWITVQLAAQEFNPWDLEILDMTGKTIRSFRSITKNKFQVSLDNLSQGIYFFRITNSSGVEIRKVVVER